MTLSFLVSMAATSPASAKSVDGLRAQIPFDFHVGDRVVSAGNYTIKSLTSDETALRIDDGKQGGVTMTSTALDNGDRCKYERCDARLVFHKYGDQYFLVAVWGADSNGRALLESKRERSLRKEVRAARNAAAEMEVVIVAAAR
jgi:hypothetical protein